MAASNAPGGNGSRRLHRFFQMNGLTAFALFAVVDVVVTVLLIATV